MRLGLAGFPGAGKTTVFSALTGLEVPAAARTEPGRSVVGTIKVPDPRLEELARIFRPRKVVHAEIAVVDFAPGAGGEREALSPAALAQLRDMDALVLVLRGFPDPIRGAPPAPLRDLVHFEGELMLADLAVIENRLERLHKQRGRERDREGELLEGARKALEKEVPLRQLEWREADESLLAGFGLLSRKPLLVVYNVPEVQAGRPLPAELAARLEASGIPGVVLSAPIEKEIAALRPEDRRAFLADLGFEEPAAERLVRAAFAALDRVSFFTVGGEEVRAWPVRRGTPAIKAAGKVHSDMERGFIRAEVIRWEDLVQLGSEAKCREAGKMHLEGKEYAVADGDVIRFRFHVTARGSSRSS